MTTYSTSEPREEGLYLCEYGSTVLLDGVWIDPNGCRCNPRGPFFGPLPSNLDGYLDLAIKIAFAEMMFATMQPTKESLRTCLAVLKRTDELAGKFYDGTRTPQLLEELRRVTALLGQTSAPHAQPGPESA